MSRIDQMIQRWNESGVSIEDRLTEALFLLEKKEAERRLLDKRIRGQRHALRVNWQIVEMRGKMMGSKVTRDRIIFLSRMLKDRNAEISKLRTLLPWWRRTFWMPHYPNRPWSACVMEQAARAVEGYNGHPNEADRCPP